ncbi:acetylornithine deacetylase [Moelleriella libera RCEF 2490]|uniref:Acetylornithine deacetylase n=1 Tax=Moelleriella libera RCEF 2490 TaxID=1081109 RepID=A0A168ARY2_9HYPO|nr:acetylornithine deacetylase [Moelleriella libera RCEF 2490]
MRPFLLFSAALGIVCPFALGSEIQKVLFDKSQPQRVASEGALDDETPSYRNELLALHKELVSIPSITFDENEVASFLVDHLTERGYNAALQFVPPPDDGPNIKERFNVAAWRGPKKANPRVIVSSHIDVVPPYIPYSIDKGKITKDTMIKGRGSVDAKGCVATMVTALNELHARDAIHDDDVMLLFVVGEEVTGDGMRTFSKSLAEMKDPPKIDAVIFGEPTELNLACGHKGGLFCDITAKGTPGHSGYPWLGKSANELMVRAMVKILDADLGVSDLFGNTTFNIGRIEGGIAGNVIPENATVNFAARVAVGPEATGQLFVKERVQAILDEVDKDAFEMDCSHGYGSVETNCDVDGFKKVTVNYGTDIPNLAGNHTRYLYGPGTILVAHGARENLTVGDLEEAVEGYQKLILHALKH